MRKFNCAQREVRVTYRCMDPFLCSGNLKENVSKNCPFKVRGKCINEQMWEKRDRLETICKRLRKKIEGRQNG